MFSLKMTLPSTRVARLACQGRIKTRNDYGNLASCVNLILCHWDMAIQSAEYSQPQRNTHTVDDGESMYSLANPDDQPRKSTPTFDDSLYSFAGGDDHTYERPRTNNNATSHFYGGTSPPIDSEHALHSCHYPAATATALAYSKDHVTNPLSDPRAPAHWEHRPHNVGVINHAGSRSRPPHHDPHIYTSQSQAKGPIYALALHHKPNRPKFPAPATGVVVYDTAPETNSLTTISTPQQYKTKSEALLDEWVQREKKRPNVYSRLVRGPESVSAASSLGPCYAEINESNEAINFALFGHDANTTDTESSFDTSTYEMHETTDRGQIVP